MEGLDLSKIGDAEKDRALKLLSEGKYQEAVTYLQKTMAGVQDQKSHDVVKTIKAIKPETGKMVEEYSHAIYRNAMVEYAKKYDKDNAERIKKRTVRVEELIIKGLIKEDDDGVSFGGIKSASKAVQEKVLQEAFPDKLQDSIGRTDHQGNDGGTKTVSNKEIKDYGNEYGDWTLCDNELEQMRDWIRNNFDDVNDRHDELFILQIINPDLFGRLAMKYNRNKYKRYATILLCLVSGRMVIMDDNPLNKYGLFLVKKV